MSLPDFLPDGFLPPGFHQAAPADFLDRFCEGDHRAKFHKPMRDVFAFATARGAATVMIGGSFVSRTETPNDLDCAIVFYREEQIPERADRVNIGGTRLDIFYCSQDRPNIVGSLASLLRRNRQNSEVGIVMIPLHDTDGAPLWEQWDMEDDDAFEIIKRSYTNRSFVDRQSKDKVLVTIHGIMTRGDWNGEITHIASSNGWIVSPFNYGYRLPTIFASKKEKDNIVGLFRDHMEEMSSLYANHVSIIAHSFGTYIVARYILGFDEIPTPIDTLVLTGSVLSEDLDIGKFSGKVHKVIHERAPNDGVAKFGRLASFARDSLLGRSAEFGFQNKSNILEERVCNVFDHTNVIRRDVIAKRWLPWMEANVGYGYDDYIRSIIERRNPTPPLNTPHSR